MRRYTVLAAAATLVLAACGDDAAEPAGDEAGAEEALADTRDTERDTADAGPPPGPAGDDGVLGSDRVEQGQWFSKTERGVPMALFGRPQTEANFVVRCEGDELVFVRSLPIEGEETEMTLMAGGETRTLTARQRPGPVPQTTARLPADDPFAAVLARTTDPIAVRLEDGASKRMPSHQALRHVVANCGGG